jgi:hypothetical protein
MTGTTSDRDDPALDNIGPSGMQEKYLVLSEQERASSFVRPFRTTYHHLTCGTNTVMGQAISETYAREPGFYGGTFCVGCHTHFPVGETGEFVWVVDGLVTDFKVGT